MRARRYAPRRVWSVVVAVGMLTGTIGLLIGIAAANPASAASLGACGGAISLVPGAKGSCTETVSDTSDPRSTPVNVTLVIDTTSKSGGGLPGSGTATEAVLDGLPSGLHVTVTDTTSGHVFALGTILCYTDPSASTAAAYPNSAYCSSSSTAETVASDVNNATFDDTFKIHWWLPRTSGNPYQGSAGSIELTSTYTGTSGSGTLGASTGPSGGQLAASTPVTGADLPETVGRLLLGAGVVLILFGLFLYMKSRDARPSEGTTFPD